MIHELHKIDRRDRASSAELRWRLTHRRFGFSSLAALAATCLLGRGRGTTGTATRGAGAAARAVAPAAARIIRAEAIYRIDPQLSPYARRHKQQDTGFGPFLSPGFSPANPFCEHAPETEHI